VNRLGVSIDPRVEMDLLVSSLFDIAAQLQPLLGHPEPRSFLLGVGGTARLSSAVLRLA
jgi:hypothetical protein